MQFFSEKSHYLIIFFSKNYQPHTDGTNRGESRDFGVTLHPTAFFYRPPNDINHYNVRCKEISITYLLNNINGYNQSNENEHIFLYQQRYDNRFFQITCEIVPPSSITSYLNETIYGISPQQNVEQEQLSFIIEQKQYLEFHLTQYLSNYVLN